MFEYSATVTRIVDGDTVDLDVALGFRIQNRDRFRLAGINTPERGQVGWAEATSALAAMIPIGAQVRIQTSHPTARDPKDKYGRWLATIFAGDLNVNQAMIDQGHAVEFMK